MKYIFIVICLISTTLYGKTNSSAICRNIDEFTDKEYLKANIVTVYGDDTKKFIVITPHIRKRNNILEVDKLIMITEEITCVKEYNILDIIFENGDKEALYNTATFNCRGNNVFLLGGYERENKFRENNIKAIRYTDGSSGRTITVKKNIGKLRSLIKDVFLEVDKINREELNLSICQK